MRQNNFTLQGLINGNYSNLSSAIYSTSLLQLNKFCGDSMDSEMNLKSSKFSKRPHNPQGDLIFQISY